MPRTYEPIATYTFSSAANSYTFSSIPQTYTDLVMVFTSTNSSSTDGISIRVGNGSLDTGSNYSVVAMLSNGAYAHQSFREVSQTSFTNMGITNTSTRQVSIYNFLNYSNTASNKVVLARTNIVDFRVSQINGYWRSSSAINTIQVRSDNASYNFTSGSTITLYGIKAA